MESKSNKGISEVSSGFLLIAWTTTIGRQSDILFLTFGIPAFQLLCWGAVLESESTLAAATTAAATTQVV